MLSAFSSSHHSFFLPATVFCPSVSYQSFLRLPSITALYPRILNLTIPSFYNLCFLLSPPHHNFFLPATVFLSIRVLPKLSTPSMHHCAIFKHFTPNICYFFMIYAFPFFPLILSCNFSYPFVTLSEALLNLPYFPLMSSKFPTFITVYVIFSLSFL